MRLLTEKHFVMTTDDNEQDDHKENVKILPPEESDISTLNLTALISHYTDRPDLFLAEVEKHDPGFIKRMNAAAEEDATELRKSRFKFGKIQAYASLGIKIIAVLVILLVVFLNADSLSFWNLVALILFFAVAQSGSTGFVEIAKSVADAIRNLKSTT